MHPPLGRTHPLCGREIEKLVECHESHPWGKWLGACNEAKVALDRCFRAEKEFMRKTNAEKAREARRRFEDKLREDKQASAATTNA